MQTPLHPSLTQLETTPLLHTQQQQQQESDPESSRSLPPPPPPPAEETNSIRMSPFWTIGCIYGATSVALGAFGAHGLKRRITDPSRLNNWSTAAHYQLVHSGVLLVAAAVTPKNRVAMALLTAGMTLFSGSIYLLVLDPVRFRAVGPVTPLGGLCLIAGWGVLALGTRGRGVLR